MRMNIACAIDGCTEPVIGQCRGHGTQCGQYYCRKHSSGKLCLECAALRLQDDIQAEYLHLAQNAERQAYPWGERVAMAILFAGLDVAGFFALVRLAAWFGWLESGEGLAPVLLLLSGFVAAMFLPGALVRLQGRRRVNRYAAKVDEAKPGFFDFYKSWRAERQREMFALTATVAVGAVVAGIAAAIEDSSEKARIRRVVEDGLRRRGY